MSFNICWGIKFQPSSETGATTQHRSWVSVPISHQLVQSLLPAQTRSNFRWKLKINWMARRTLNFFQFVGGRIFMMIGIQKFYPRFSLKATKSPQNFRSKIKIQFSVKVWFGRKQFQVFSTRLKSNHLWQKRSLNEKSVQVLCVITGLKLTILKQCIVRWCLRLCMYQIIKYK